MKEPKVLSVRYLAAQTYKKRAYGNTAPHHWTLLNPDRATYSLGNDATLIYDRPTDTLTIQHPLMGLIPVNESADLDAYQRAVRSLATLN